MYTKESKIVDKSCRIFVPSRSVNMPAELSAALLPTFLLAVQLQEFRAVFIKHIFILEYKYSVTTQKATQVKVQQTKSI